MKSIQFTLPMAVTILIVIVGTYFQGSYSGRWMRNDSSENLLEMSKKIDNIPLEFGDWVGVVQEDTDSLKFQYKTARVVGHTNITYKNKKTNKSVSISLVCGKFEHVSIHTPNQCYVGAGYEQVNNRQEKTPVDFPEGTAHFFTAQFRKHGFSSSDNQRIFWSWASDKNKNRWIAEDNRREIRLKLDNELYKLYVTTRIKGQETSDDVSLNKDFIREFLPALNEALWPSENDDDLLGS